MITELRTKLENAQGAEVRLQALQAEMANGHKGVQIVYQDRIVEKVVEKDKIVEKVVYVSAAVCGCRQSEVYTVKCTSLLLGVVVDDVVCM